MKDRLELLIFENRWAVAAALGGLILLGAGIFLLRAGVFEGTRIEVIESDEEARLRQGFGEAKEVVVEVAGEIINPGVYSLPPESRVEDLLVASGGLAANADREWIAKGLNRAAKLIDGAKIYIPALGETNTPEVGVPAQININTATAAELDRLWGIGPARASAIIDGRPYSSVEELLTKKIIPSNVYERIKDEITAP